MLQFLTYQTPAKFFKEFSEHADTTNLRSVKVISGFLFAISSVGRIISMFFKEDVVLIQGYQQFSLNNWFQIFGSAIFFILSTYAIKQRHRALVKKIVIFVFVAYFLTMAFNISYIVSQYNTKIRYSYFWWALRLRVYSSQWRLNR